MTQRFTTALLRVSPLLVLVVLTLVPYGWIAEHSPLVRRLVYGLFSSEAAHWVAHALTFAAIGAAMLVRFPRLLGRPWVYLGLILLIALGQEGLQLIYKGRGVIANDIFDIGLDLAAAFGTFALGRYAVARGRARSRRKP